MDKTDSDNEYVKSWYKDADSIKKLYNITAYPTLLFLSPNGDLVNRTTGLQTVKTFIRTAAESLDTLNNYPALVHQYYKKELSYTDMALLALKARKMNDINIAGLVSKDYKTNHLDKIPIDSLMNKEKLSFIDKFADLVNSKDNFFKLFYSMPNEVDSILNQNGFSRIFVNYVITKEEIDRHLWNNGKPNNMSPEWRKYEEEITKKYSEKIARTIITRAKLKWYSFRKDWPKTIKYNIEYIESQPIDTSFMGMFMLNNMIYDIIFRHSNNSIEIDKGLMWIKLLLEKEPNHYKWIDTYANLLYKKGETKEAIQQEKKAFKIALEKKDKESIKEFEIIIEKMKKGNPTW